MKVGKEKLHSLKGEDNTLMATEPPQKKNKKNRQTRNKLENIAASSKVVWEDCKLFFFFSSALRDEE